MIKNITVVGAGTMGHGIAHVFARKGYNVSIYEPFEAVREQAMEKISGELQLWWTKITSLQKKKKKH